MKRHLILLFLFSTYVYSGWSQFEALHTFVDSTGLYPYYSYIAGDSSNLYGTTTEGGKYGYGVIFNFHLQNKEYHVLHHFSGEDGKNPVGNILLIDTMIYGVTRNGGTYESGILYAFNLNKSKLKVLHHFTDRELSPDISFNNNSIYGSSCIPGSLDGIIYQFDLSAGTYRELKQIPHCNMGISVTSNKNKIYGIADSLIFMTDTSGNNLSVIYKFDHQVEGSLSVKSDTLCGFVTGPYHLLFIADTLSGLTDLIELEQDYGLYYCYGPPLLKDGHIYGATSVQSKIFDYNIEQKELNVIARLDAFDYGHRPYSAVTYIDGYYYLTSTEAASQRTGVLLRFEKSELVILDQPEDVHVCLQFSPSFIVNEIVVDGINPYYFYWQVKTEDTWQTIDSVTNYWNFNSNSSNLLVDLIDTVKDNSYRCMVANGYDSIYSDVFTIHYSENMPVFLKDPEDKAANSGEEVLFEVEVSDSKGLSYQWTLNNVPIQDTGFFSGSNSRALTIHEVISDYQGSYICQISNYCGINFSQPAYLSVTTSYKDHPGRKIKIYPNPATQIVNISGLMDQSEIIIKDYSGKTMDMYLHPTGVISIDLTHLSPGMYVFIIRNGNSVVQKKVAIY